MHIGQSLKTGFSRVNQFPGILFWLYLASVLLSLPLAAVIFVDVEQSIGHSLIHRELSEGFDMDWYREFELGRSGVGGSFGPQVIGVLAPLTNFEMLLDGALFGQEKSILICGLLFLLVWVLLGGGIIDHYAGADKSFSVGKLLSLGSRFFFRLARLVALAVVAYWAASRWIADALQGWLEHATLDATTETEVALLDLLAYCLFAFVLVLLGVVFDYAKISLVLERRRSVLVALVRGFGMVRRHPVQTVGLYLILALFGFLLVSFYGLIAPGPGQSNLTTVTFAFVIGQLYLLGRMFIKLWLLSSQISLYRTNQS